MAEKAVPWWRKVIQFAIQGIRAVFHMHPENGAVLNQLGLNEYDDSASLQDKLEENALTEQSSNPASPPATVAAAAEPAVPIAQDIVPALSAGPVAEPAPEPEAPIEPAEEMAGTPEPVEEEDEIAAVEPVERTLESEAVQAIEPTTPESSPEEVVPTDVPAETPAEPAAFAEELEPVAAEQALGATESVEVVPAAPENESAETPALVAEEDEIAAIELVEGTPESEAVQAIEPTTPESSPEEVVPADAPAETPAEPIAAAAAEPVEEVAKTSAPDAEENEAIQTVEPAVPESTPAETAPATPENESVEAVSEVELAEAATESEQIEAPGESSTADSAEESVAEETAREAIVEAAEEPDMPSDAVRIAESSAASLPELEAPVAEPLAAEQEPAPESAAQPTASEQPQTAPEETPAPQAVTAPTAAPRPAPEPAPPQAIKREDGPEHSPFSVIVSQVYEGPLDLLLDLIRKQDIDIYDIPIAKITAQFLTYVNSLRGADMDVAGEFIYTASLLIHIKSRMLLPREPAGPDEEQEDPRRELVERLLEHERFKNAAQMLQQKQMVEAATWTNPGVREFVDDVGAEPEIAADTVDLVRIFREILERVRSRPIINVEEDTVTVGQMIQFLSRRLTMEDKPIALRRLLSHTRSERALIAMFLALLELVRLQAILLRQDSQFSEIFIKKNSDFEAVIEQCLARDDWQ